MEFSGNQKMPWLGRGRRPVIWADDPRDLAPRGKEVARGAGDRRDRPDSLPTQGGGDLPISLPHPADPVFRFPAVRACAPHSAAKNASIWASVPMLTRRKFSVRPPGK